jgi:hypothetical protein
VRGGNRGDFASSGFADVGRAAAGKDFQHRRVRDTWAEDALQRGVDAGEQAAGAVGDFGGLGVQVVIEADQNTERGQGIVAGVDRRRAWGRVRAASAMTRASVLARGRPRPAARRWWRTGQLRPVPLEKSSLLVKLRVCTR